MASRRDDGGAGGAAPGAAAYVPKPGATIATAFRIDRGDLLPPQRTKEGFLLVEGRIAKPGILRYVRADGTVVRELLPPSTLYDRKGLDTLARKPVTLEHPRDGVDVTPDNVRDLGVGDIDGTIILPTEEEQRVGGFVTIRMAVRRKDAIQAVEDGKVELSPGYKCGIDNTPGVDPVFGAYDAVQVWREYNHGAIVDTARGGHDVRMRADGLAPLREGEDARRTDSGGPVNKRLIELLMTLGLSRVDAATAVEKGDSAAMGVLQDAYEKLAADVAKKDEKIAGMAAELEKYKKGEEAEAKAKAETPTAAQEDEMDPAAMKADSKARVDALIAYAEARTPLLDLASELKIDGAAKMANGRLRRAILAKKDARVPADASAEYVRARVDSLLAARADSAKESPFNTVVPGGSFKPADPTRTDGQDGGKRTDDGLDPWRRGQLAAKRDRANPTA